MSSEYKLFLKQAMLKFNTAHISLSSVIIVVQRSHHLSNVQTSWRCRTTTWSEASVEEHWYSAGSWYVIMFNDPSVIFVTVYKEQRAP